MKLEMRPAPTPMCSFSTIPRTAPSVVRGLKFECFASIARQQRDARMTSSARLSCGSFGRLRQITCSASYELDHVAVVVAHLLDQLLKVLVDVAVRGAAEGSAGRAAAAQQRRRICAQIEQLCAGVSASFASFSESAVAKHVDKADAASNSRAPPPMEAWGRRGPVRPLPTDGPNVFVACMNASEGPHSASRKRVRSTLGGSRWRRNSCSTQHLAETPTSWLATLLGRPAANRRCRRNNRRPALRRDSIPSSSRHRRPL